MEYTENYNLKKPDAEDLYNVEDFNTNADTVDKELKKHGDDISLLQNLQWTIIQLSDFADMMVLDNHPKAQWKGTIAYNRETRMVKAHLYTTSAADEFNTAGSVIGVIKWPFQPAFDQYGFAMIIANGNRYVCSLRVDTLGRIVTEQGSIQSFSIGNFDSIDITYIAVQSNTNKGG